MDVDCGQSGLFQNQHQRLRAHRDVGTVDSRREHSWWRRARQGVSKRRRLGSLGVHPRRHPRLGVASPARTAARFRLGHGRDAFLRHGLGRGRDQMACRGIAHFGPARSPRQQGAGIGGVARVWKPPRQFSGGARGSGFGLGDQPQLGSAVGERASGGARMEWRRGDVRQPH